jgi:hypothetical protein
VEEVAKPPRVDVRALPDQPVMVAQLSADEMKQLGTVGGLIGEASTAQGNSARTTVTPRGGGLRLDLSGFLPPGSALAQAVLEFESPAFVSC